MLLIYSILILVGLFLLFALFGIILLAVEGNDSSDGNSNELPKEEVLDVLRYTKRKLKGEDKRFIYLKDIKKNTRDLFYMGDYYICTIKHNDTEVILESDKKTLISCAKIKGGISVVDPEDIEKIGPDKSNIAIDLYFLIMKSLRSRKKNMKEGVNFCGLYARHNSETSGHVSVSESEMNSLVMDIKKYRKKSLKEYKRKRFEESRDMGEYDTSTGFNSMI
jgi:hypothetical protein